MSRKNLRPRHVPCDVRECGGVDGYGVHRYLDNADGDADSEVSEDALAVEEEVGDGEDTPGDRDIESESKCTVRFSLLAFSA